MITMKFDSKRLNEVFRDAPKRALLAAGTELRTAGKVFAGVAARNTLPYGAYETAPDAAMDTVQNQIKRTQVPIDSLGSMWQVLKAVDKGLAAAFWTAVKARKMGLAKQILDNLVTAGGSFTHGAVSPDVHTKARTGIRRSVPKDHKPTHIITSAGAALNTYIKKKQRTIGAAKAGWAAAAKAMGGAVSAREGFKKWYNTGVHKRATGTAVLIQTKDKTVLKLTNSVPWSSEAFLADRKRATEREFLPHLKKAIETKKAALAAAALKRKAGGRK